MKLLLLLALMPVIAFSQTDSLSNTLQRYKTMYEQGLIDSSEYKALKAKAAGISQPTAQQTPTVVTIVRQSNPVAKYKAKTGVGGMFLGIGCTLFVADFAYIAVSGRKTPYPANRKQNIIGISVGCAVSTILGAALVGAGQHERALYESKKAALNIQLNNNTVGLALNF